MNKKKVKGAALLEGKHNRLLFLEFIYEKFNKRKKRAFMRERKERFQHLIKYIFYKILTKYKKVNLVDYQKFLIIF